MSYADKVFVENAKLILEHGTTTKGQKVRPVWPDGTPAYTIKTFGIVNRYDLRKEFPAITVRRTGIKSAFDEILWIFQRQSNNINDLKPHIWDEWADEDGSIGKAYGYQVGQKYIHHKEKSAFMNHEAIKQDTYLPEGCVSVTVEGKIIDGAEMYQKVYEIAMNQIDAVIYDLKNQPFSRRIMTSLWNFQDLHEMNLQPCCYNCTFNVTDEGGDKLVLNMILNQRSNDFLAANNWNVVQYALLQMMIAQVCDMVPGEFVHVIADQHIYDRHVDIVKELITREQFPAPKVSLNPEIKDFYDFKPEDLIIEDYVTGPQVTDIPIAI